MLTKCWQFVAFNTDTFCDFFEFWLLEWLNVGVVLLECIVAVVLVRTLFDIVGRKRTLFSSRTASRSLTDIRLVLNGRENFSRFSLRSLFVLCLSLRQRKFEMPKRIESFELSFWPFLTVIYGFYSSIFVFWWVKKTLSGLYSFHLELFLAVWKFWDLKFHQFEIYDFISISKLNLNELTKRRPGGFIPLLWTNTFVYIQRKRPNINK